MKPNRLPSTDLYAAVSARRRWFLRGICFGAVLGLWPAYQVLTMSTTKVTLLRDAGETTRGVPRSRESTNIRLDCEILTKQATKVLGLIDKRQHALSSLATYIGAAWADFPDVQSDQTDERIDFTGREFAGRREYLAAVRQLGHLWERESMHQAGLWSTLGGAKPILQQCDQWKTEQITGSNQPSANLGEIGVPVLGQRVNIETAKLARSLSETSDIPSPLQLVATAGTVVGAADTKEDRRTELPRRTYYRDWFGKWLYALGEGAIAPSRTDIAGVQIHSRSVQQARESLLEGLLETRVQPDRLVRDLVVGNPGLVQRLAQLIEMVEIRVHQHPESGSRWVETRVPLAGTGGLMPLVLPFVASKFPRAEIATERREANIAAPLVGNGAAGRVETAVVLDARGTEVEPMLLPRVLSRSGAVVLDAARIDPNVVVNRGFCAYTPYEGSAIYLAGQQTLWLKVQGSGRGGELIVDDRDGAQLKTIAMSDYPSNLRLLILVD